MGDHVVPPVDAHPDQRARQQLAHHPLDLEGRNARAGLASKQIDTKGSPEKRDKNLNKGAEKMRKNFPPKPKKAT